LAKVRTDGKITKVKVRCSLRGTRLKGDDRASNCGITVNRKTRKAAVKATPNCGAGLKIKATIVAKASGETRVEWTRTWKVRKDPSVLCTLGGNG